MKSIEGKYFKLDELKNIVESIIHMWNRIYDSDSGKLKKIYQDDTYSTMNKMIELLNSKING